jgi:hypothetical protein
MASSQRPAVLAAAILVLILPMACQARTAARALQQGEAPGADAALRCCGAPRCWCLCCNHPFPLPAAAKRPPPPPPALDTQSKDLLDRHNSYRAKHNVPNLTWDPKLAASARTLANECVYEMSVLGQNIWQTNLPSVNIGALTGEWYGEVGLDQLCSS